MSRKVLPYQKRSEARSWRLVSLVGRCRIGDMIHFLHCDNNARNYESSCTAVKKYPIEEKKKEDK